MRQVSVKQLYSNLSTELADLPFEITKHGKVVAVVTSSAGISLDFQGLDRKSLDATGIEFRPYSKNMQTGKAKKPS